MFDKNERETLKKIGLNYIFIEEKDTNKKLVILDYLKQKPF